METLFATWEYTFRKICALSEIEFFLNFRINIFKFYELRNFIFVCETNKKARWERRAGKFTRKVME